MRQQQAGALLLVALALLVCACHSTAMNCTAIGASSGVDFNLRRVQEKHPDTALVVRMCVQSLCSTAHVPAENGASDVRAALSAADGPIEVPVTLRVTNGESGSVVFSGSTMVGLHKFQPNGPDCAPTVWVGAVTAAGQTLVPN